GPGGPAAAALPADPAARALPQRATAALATRGLPATGVLPHFLTHTRRTGKLVDRWQGRTSGGPIKLLDLDAMRRTATAAAAAEWLLWQQAVPRAKPANPFWWYLPHHT